MTRHYVYVVHDALKRQNHIDVAPTLHAVEKEIAAVNRKHADKVYARKFALAAAKHRDSPEKAFEVAEFLMKAKKRHAVIHLVYYECLPGPREARERLGYLVSEEGRKELRRWLQRLNRTNVID